MFAGPVRPFAANILLRKGELGDLVIEASDRKQHESGSLDSRENPAKKAMAFAAFQRWNAAGIRWALLRVIDASGIQGDDVDVIVHPDDLERAEATLRPEFVRLPAVGRGTHRFLLALDEEHGEWTQLDIVTELAFGAYGQFRSATADAVLADRTAHADGTFTLAAQDLAWSVVLHCMLDKQSVAPKYVELFTALGVDLTADAGAVSTMPLQCRNAVIRLFDDRGITGIADDARDVIALWRTAVPETTARERSGRIARLAEKPMQFRKRRGPIVALLGPDGSGKSSLSRAFVEKSFFPTTPMYFGLWKNVDSSPTVAKSMVAAAVRPARAFTTYLAGKKASMLGRTVIFDRHVIDARLPVAPPLVAAKTAYMWVIARSCPMPDLVIRLDAPGDVMFARKGEKSSEELERERAAFKLVADALSKPVLVLDTTKSLDDVTNEALAFVWQFQRNRLQGRRSQ